MLQQASYEDGARHLTVKVERIDEWLTTTDHIVNFPRVVQLAGDRLLLCYTQGRHGGEIGPAALLSDDSGATWRDPPLDLDIANLDTCSYLAKSSGGSLAYLRDGTIAYINMLTLGAIGWRGGAAGVGPHPLECREADPTFLLRKFSPSGALLEEIPFNLTGLPWPEASYQAYGTLLELDDGDLLTSFCVSVRPAEELPDLDPRGRKRYRFSFGNLIVRSSDGGRSWRFVAFLDPEEVQPTYGIGDREVDGDGLDEPSLAALPNGDLYLIMRTGSYSPMFHCRSRDGGETWTTPVNTGWPGVRPDLRLLSNGALACCSGRGGYGHPQVTHVMFSLDGTGRHWETPFAFHTGPGCSYAVTMERDGKLHVVYSHSDFTREQGTYGLPCQAIKCAVLDVTTSEQ